MKFLDCLSQPSQTLSLYTFLKSATCEKLSIQQELKHTVLLSRNISSGKSIIVLAITVDVYTNAEYWGNKQVLKPEARDLAQLWSCESRNRLSTDTDGTLGNRRTFFLLRQGLR